MTVRVPECVWNANDIKFILIRLMLCSAVVLLKNQQKVVAGRLKSEPNQYKLDIVLETHRKKFKARHTKVSGEDEGKNKIIKKAY